jgi:hypothetical protein
MTRRASLRRALLILAPAALAAQVAPPSRGAMQEPPAEDSDEARLPNGKSRREAILKADYEQNLKDAENLAIRAREVQEELEKSDQNVLSVGLLKQLDEIEKLTRRIRGRMRRI